MLTLMLTPRTTEETVHLGAAAVRRGIRVLQATRWTIPTVDPARTLLYGGELFVQYACQELGIPVPAVDPDWLPALAPDLVHRRLFRTRLWDARSLPGPIFVKPVQEKSFPAAVYASGAELPDLPPDEPVYVSEVVNFTREYRCFMTHGHCVAVVLYAVNGRPTSAMGAEEFCTRAGQVAEQAWSRHRTLPAGVVIDVGVISTGAIAVIEANSVAESALYGVDPDLALESLAALFGHQLT